MRLQLAGVVLLIPGTPRTESEYGKLSELWMAICVLHGDLCIMHFQELDGRYF